jgi:membrane-associated phospholipid phosphatase
MWWFAVLFILSVGLSRIYLGHHFVHDVVAGAFLGGLVIVGYGLWLREAHKLFNKRILGFRLLVAILVPVGLALVYTAVFFIIGKPNMNVPWANFIESAERESIESVATVLATMLGTGIGLVFEPSRIRFRVEGPVWKRTVRYLVGMAVAIGIWAGLDSIFPEDPLAIAIPFRVIRYTLLALWLTYYAPAMFVLLRLADADPKPEISLKIE